MYRRNINALYIIKRTCVKVSRIKQTQCAVSQAVEAVGYVHTYTGGSTLIVNRYSSESAAAFRGDQAGRVASGTIVRHNL